jgi:hypothetical protein
MVFYILMLVYEIVDTIESCFLALSDFFGSSFIFLVLSCLIFKGAFLLLIFWLLVLSTVEHSACLYWW